MVSHKAAVVFSSGPIFPDNETTPCLLYTSDAADETYCVDLGGLGDVYKRQGFVILKDRATRKHHSCFVAHQNSSSLFTHLECINCLDALQGTSLTNV